jgi:trypsin
LTATVRGSRTIVRVGTEEWLRQGPNQRMSRNRRPTCRQIRSSDPKRSALHETGVSPADILVRVNSKDPSKAEGFALPAHPQPGQSGWFFSTTRKDIAVIQVNYPYLLDQGYQVAFFPGDTATAKRDKLKELEVSAGDGVFVLGFPMNLAGVQRNYVIVRQGSVARISNLLDYTSDTFLIDSFVFPGNSGGPVVLRPEIVSISGTKSQANAYLVGVVISYEPYSDVAVSAQTKQPRVVFQENSGLADVLPIDDVDDAISRWRSTRQTASPATPSRTTPGP